MGCTFSTGRRVWEGEKNLGLFHLKWLILVQIQLYFNRNVRQFTAGTITVTCIMYCWRLRGGESIEALEPLSLRPGWCGCNAKVPGRSSFAVLIRRYGNAWHIGLSCTAVMLSCESVLNLRDYTLVQSSHVDMSCTLKCGWFLLHTKYLPCDYFTYLSLFGHTLVLFTFS